MSIISLSSMIPRTGITRYESERRARALAAVRVTVSYPHESQYGIVLSGRAVLSDRRLYRALAGDLGTPNYALKVADEIARTNAQWLAQWMKGGCSYPPSILFTSDTAKINWQLSSPEYVGPNEF